MFEGKLKERKKAVNYLYATFRSSAQGTKTNCSYVFGVFADLTSEPLFFPQNFFYLMSTVADVSDLCMALGRELKNTKKYQRTTIGIILKVRSRCMQLLIAEPEAKH